MKLFERMLVQMCSICFMVDHNVTVVIRYSITFDIGRSGSEDAFTLTVHGNRDTMERSIHKTFRDNHGIYTFKTANENLGRIKSISIKSHGVDGLSILSITIETNTHLYITNCDCLVDDGSVIVKPITRTVCKESNMDLFCNYLEYTIKAFRKNAINISSNLPFTLVGDLGKAAFNIPFERTERIITVVKVGENIGKISSGAFTKVQVAVDKLTVSDTRYEYHFDLGGSSGVKGFVNASKTICLYGWKDKSECDEIRYRLIVEMRNPAASNKALNITATGEEKSNIFSVDKLGNERIKIIIKDSPFLGRLSKLEIKSQKVISTIKANDGRMKYFFKSNKSEGIVFVNKAYCTGARRNLDQCDNIFYDIRVKITGNFKVGRTRLIIEMSDGQRKVNLVMSLRNTASPQTISLSKSDKAIKTLRKVSLLSYDANLQTLELCVHDGRITYLFVYRNQTELKLTKIYCPPGYHGKLCMDICNSSKWGYDCKKHCRCKGGCDPVTGKCKGQCDGGRIGVSCHNACPDGMFGVDCRHECHCALIKHCHGLTGECGVGGCMKRWAGSSCQTPVCPAGHKYGSGCEKSCHCASGTCDPHTGVCASGCDHAHYGHDCQLSCVLGTFGNGTNCTGQCHCDVKQECRVSDGKCLVGGCAKGWADDDCQARCLYGKPPCLAACACSGQPCDRLNGSCFCGWRTFGNVCEKTCPTKRYFAKPTDKTCEGTCHCKNDSLCQVWDGVCVGGACNLGWSGPKCHDQVNKGSASMRYVTGYVAAAASGVFLVVAVVFFIRHAKRKKPVENDDITPATNINAVKNITSGMTAEQVQSLCKSLNSLTNLASNTAVKGNKSMTKYLDQTLTPTIALLATKLKTSETTNDGLAVGSSSKISRAPSKTSNKSSMRIRVRRDSRDAITDDFNSEEVQMLLKKRYLRSMSVVSATKPKATKSLTPRPDHKSRKSKSVTNNAN